MTTTEIGNGVRGVGIVRSVAALACALACHTASAVPVHTTYAVLFSGGVNAASNHDRYYDETLRMWQISTALFGVDNVWVLFGDGTDPGIDRSSGQNSDWSAITGAGGHITLGTHAELETRLTELSELITLDDSFYFWAFDHGSGDETPPAPAAMPYQALLNGWGVDNVIRDDELAAWVAPIDAKAEAYVFGQCFSGGMADDLLAGPDAANRFVAWAQSDFGCSFGQGWIDAWADALEDPAVGWSTHELGRYAMDHDPFGFGPGGSGDERPGYAGYNFHFITNEAVPEPPAVALAALGLLVLLRARRGRGGWSCRGPGGPASQ